MKQLKCSWLHEECDCDDYIKGGYCGERSCKKQHRKMCKYWAYRDEGCLRGDICQYLRTIIREYPENKNSFSDCKSTTNSENEREEQNEEEMSTPKKNPQLNKETKWRLILSNLSTELIRNQFLNK